MAANSTTKTSELLIVTRNELGALSRVTGPLAQNNINIECYCSYDWGNESAFRFITNNNKKAREVLTKAGWNVQENPAVLWTAPNKPGVLRRATSALSEMRINIYASYSIAQPGESTCMVAFTTSDPVKTMETLNRI
jgi:hypothetical protein